MSRLVVFAPNWLGDAVMALPAIGDIRHALPDAWLAVAARQAVAPLFDMIPGVDEVVMAGQERAGPPYDAAILLPNSFHSALAAWRAGIPERF
jgi:heptosyltransferase-2